MWQWPTLESILADLRYTLRQLCRAPGFAVTAIVVLALGIGASVAIFAFVDAALLEPLPYADPNRLMAVNESSAESPLWPLAYPDFVDWQRMNKSLSSLDVFAGAGYLLRTRDGAEPVTAGRVSGGFFRTLGVRPILGRDFAAGEDRLGGPNMTLISYGAWLHRFGGRNDVVGQTVSLDNTAYTILGVLPRSFSFALAGNAEFWVPINTLSPHEQTRNFFNFFGVGRLRDGVSRQTAQAEMTAIEKQLQKQYPNQGRDLTAQVVPLAEVFVGNIRPILLTLLGGAVLLLVIACVNVASLVLVRSESRRREVAVRGALGRDARTTRPAICGRRAFDGRGRRTLRSAGCRRIDAAAGQAGAKGYGGEHAVSRWRESERAYDGLCLRCCAWGRIAPCRDRDGAALVPETARRVGGGRSGGGKQAMAEAGSQSCSD